MTTIDTDNVFHSAELCSVTSRATVTELDLDELGSRIVGLAGRIAAATCRWLLLVADFDQREGWGRWGLASTAQWLSHTCGISHRTAIDHVRVARALVGFPELAAALDAGRISYSHSRAISRLARAGEERLVGDLIEVAEHGSVGQLETVVRGLRTVDDNVAGTRDAGEYLRHAYSSRTSHWRMSTRLDPERGAVVKTAVAALAAAEGITQADALVRMAQIALAALNRSENGPPRVLRGHEHAAVLIELTPPDVAAARPPAPASTAAALPSPTAAQVPDAPRSRERTDAAPRICAGPDERLHGDRPPTERPLGRISGGGPGLPRRVVERLLCSCRIHVAVVADGRNVLDLGRRRRVVDDRQFRALLLRDRHCAHPGCTSKHKLEAHHVVHWLHGGRTDIANLVLLCIRHHHAHHDGEFSIVRVGSSRRGSFVFRRADGQVLDHHVDPSRHIAAAARLESEYREFPDAAILSKSVGDRLDRAWAISVLADRRYAAPTRPDPMAA